MCSLALLLPSVAQNRCWSTGLSTEKEILPPQKRMVVSTHPEDDLRQFYRSVKAQGSLNQYINSQGLLQQNTINLETQHNRNLFSQSSGGKKAEIKVLAGLCLLWESKKNLFHASLLSSDCCHTTLEFLGAVFHSQPIGDQCCGWFSHCGYC